MDINDLTTSNLQNRLQSKIKEIYNMYNNIENTNNDFATYLRLTGNINTASSVVDSHGNSIVLSVEEHHAPGPMGDTISAIVYIIKYSPDGKKELSKIEYDSFKKGSSIDIPISIDIDRDDNVYLSGISLKLPISMDSDLLSLLVQLILLLGYILILFLKDDLEELSQIFKLDFIRACLLKFDSKNMSKDSTPIYSYYLCGNGVNMANSVAVSNNHVWLTGLTSSTGSIEEETGIIAYQDENKGDFDAFVCKINKDTPNLEYITYVGGKLRDIGNSICVDSNENVYVTGVCDQAIKDETETGTFNVYADAFQKNFGGGPSDAFVMKLKSTGEVVYCSYLGGADGDLGQSITSDEYGNAYIIGNTGEHFPIKGDVFQKDFGLRSKGVFVCKIDPNGNEILASSFIGGSYSESASSIKYANNNVYLLGNTDSKDFPMVPTTYIPVYFGNTDFFFCTLSSDLKTLKFSSYMGGTKTETSRALNILNDGSFIITGETFSHDFPTTPGAAYEEYKNNRAEGVICRCTPTNFDIEVTINDPILKNELLKLLKKSNTDKITKFDLQTLSRNINLNGKDIKNIEGLQHAKYLLSLKLSDNEIYDLTPIENLKYLNFLDLRSNKIDDISTISKLKDLSYLYISNNNISDISPLAALTKLTELKGENNKISSIEAISKFLRVRTLKFDGNSIGDLTYLSGLKFLSNYSFLDQKITKSIKKTSTENIVLSLDFLKKINGELPFITAISNNGKLDINSKTITWIGITENTNLTFNFSGLTDDNTIEYMSGKVTVEVEIKDTIIGTPISPIIFSTYLSFETISQLVSLVKDKMGNFFVLYNLCTMQIDEYSRFPISRGIVIKKISSDGKTELGKKIYSLLDNESTKNKLLSSSKMVIDDNGDIYISGTTNWISFPTTPNTLKPHMSLLKILTSETEGFIMKFRGADLNTNSTPLFSTFFGGSKKDGCSSIDIDSDKNIWIAGTTYSHNFPITDTAAQKIFEGIWGSLYVAKLNNSLNKIEYATFIGADKSLNSLGELTVDSKGNAYITGMAEYVVAKEFRYGNFMPTKQGKWQTTPNAYQKKFGKGESDAYIVKFTPEGKIAYLTYLGGKKMDLGTAIAVDNDGCAYITGYTSGDFVITENAYSNIYDARRSAIFISKLSENGDKLLSSTYFGGSYNNTSTDISIFKDKIYLVGSTDSLDFETTQSAIESQYKKGSHGFLSILDKDLSVLKYSTFIGGSSTDSVTQVLVDSDDIVTISGITDSKDFPITKGVFSETISNNTPDAYVGADGFLMELRITEDN